jgi:hypothetical protein
MKKIMYNPITKDILATQSENKVQKLIEEGYILIGDVKGFNVVVTTPGKFK